MSLEIRPQSHDERDKIVGAIETWRGTAGVSPEDISIETRVFSGARLTYVGARAAHQAAAAASFAASDAADVGDARFDRAFRTWVSSVRDGAGKSLVSELTALLGGMPPSDLTSRPYREEHTGATRLREQLRGRPALQGEAPKLAAFDEALTAFGPLITADEAAVREKVARGTALETATEAFDRAYSKLVRALRSILGDERTFEVLPRFSRPDPSPGPTGGDGGTPS